MSQTQIKMINNKNLIRYISFSLLTLFLVVGHFSNAFAKQGNIDIECFLGSGTGPKDEEIKFGTEIGGGAGIGYEIIDNLQFRVDISYYTWSKNPTFFGITGEEKLRNLPVFLGGRYLFPLAPNFKFFGELGLSVNFLKAEISWASISDSESKTKIGAIPGIGGYFMITPQLGLGLGLRYNIINKGIGDADQLDPSFFSTEALLTYLL